MQLTQLRTYTLTDEAARDAYLPRWSAHVGSLADFGVETLGFFPSRTDPRVAVALVRFPDGADPDEVISRYLLSDGFASDMSGFDMSRIERVETAIVDPTAETTIARTGGEPEPGLGSRRLDGRVAVITGGARGQGAAEARVFAAEGADVVIADLLEEQGEQVAREIRDSGGRALALRLDVGDAESWSRLAQEIDDRFGRLDVLVNNAGINVREDLTHTAREQWDRILQVNLTGQALGMQALAELLRRSPHGASVINVGSTAGIMGHPVAGYSSSKWGVRGLTKAAATEFAADGIRVNALHPGVVSTPMMDPTGPLFATLVSLTPLRRAATVDELAYAALFLAGDESSFITGIDLPVDGGFSELGTYDHVWRTLHETPAGDPAATG